MVINNAIDLTEFSCEKYSNIKGPKLRFIQIGRLEDSKNQKFSLQVFRILHERIREVELVFIGEGPQEGYIRTETERLSLGESVHILPSTADIPLELAKSNYMLFPSIHEGLGIVAIEAQAMNLVCFASTAVPYEADCGKCVFLDLKKGHKYWAEKILEHIYSIDDGQSDMSAYDIDEISKTYRKVYKGDTTL